MSVDKIEEFCLKLITYAGNAKSSYIEAISYVKNKDYEKAEELFKEGKKSYIECHNIHQQMFAKNYNIDNFKQSLLLMHAEDQMMACETIFVLANEIACCYKKIEKLENKG